MLCNRVMHSASISHHSTLACMADTSHTCHTADIGSHEPPLSAFTTWRRHSTCVGGRRTFELSATSEARDHDDRYDAAAAVSSCALRCSHSPLFCPLRNTTTCQAVVIIMLSLGVVVIAMSSSSALHAGKNIRGGPLEGATVGSGWGTNIHWTAETRKGEAAMLSKAYRCE